MSSNLAQKGRTLAKNCTYVQVVTSIVLFLIVYVSFPEYTLAVLVGCIAFILPTGFFAYWYFRYAGATKSDVVLRSFNQGLKVKLMLTSLCFAIAFSKFNVHPIPLLGAYAITTLSHLAAMCYFNNR